MIQFDEHVFQMGWFNHQLGTYRQINPYESFKFGICCGCSKKKNHDSNHDVNRSAGNVRNDEKTLKETPIQVVHMTWFGMHLNGNVWELDREKTMRMDFFWGDVFEVEGEESGRVFRGHFFWGGGNFGSNQKEFKDKFA